MRRPNYNQGFSLIEVMVALVISALLLGGLVITFTNANTNYSELTKASRQIENGRYAMSVIEADLRHAGLYGEYTGSRAVYNPVSPTAPVQPDPCNDEPAQLLAGLMVPVYGYAGAGAAPIGCLPNYKAGTDVLVVRRTSTNGVTNKALLDANTVYFQGTMDSLGSTTPGLTGPYLAYGGDADWDDTYQLGTVPIHQFLVHIYYIANCRDCSGSGDGIPTLIRRDYIGRQKFVSVPIAEGIEQLHFRYGVDQSGNNLYGSPSQYKVAGAVTLNPEWANVVAVEVSLLARNTQETRGYKDTKVYHLGEKTIDAQNDAFRRHAFTQVVRLVIPASRKEDVYQNNLWQEQ